MGNSPFKVYGLQALYSLTKSPSMRTCFESGVRLFIHISCFFLKRGKDSLNYVKPISCPNTFLDSYRCCHVHTHDGGQRGGSTYSSQDKKQIVIRCVSKHVLHHARDLIAL